MLKLAEQEDFEEIKRMAYRFHSESPYANQTIEEQKVDFLINNVLSSPKTQSICILSMDTSPVGMITGVVSECLFSTETTATELMYWVDEKYRKGDRGLRLIEAYEYWAENVAKAKYCAMIALEDRLAPVIGRFYTRRGFRKVENTYLKELK